MENTANTVQIDNLSHTIIPAQSVLSASDSDEWLMATHGKTFHFAARFLSPTLRRHIAILYAFFRTVDDLVDAPPAGRQRDDIRKEVENWRFWFTENHTFPAPQEPLGTRLASVLTEHCVPTTIFLDFLDGMSSDLKSQEIHDFQEMYRYCYRVAGTVGLAITHMLGVRSPQALEAAEKLGIGMQLTNILRDVGGDLAAGRIYLPLEDLARFDCSPTYLFQLYRDQRGPDDRFRALMRYQVARAHRYYVSGMSGIWLLPAECRLPILLAGRLYRRILAEIERKDYDVIRSRASTSTTEKMREAAIAFTLDRLWRRGEIFTATEAGVPLED
ncbi:MAG TPA: phytoene/squalene synthase family protein [Ktedonobacteraceae bacterium]|nr:phytoene/squalene synthase family protein [Ktedonobacteraceae bacterium]